MFTDAAFIWSNYSKNSNIVNFLILFFKQALFLSLLSHDPTEII